MNKNGQGTQSFSSVLDALFTQEPLPIHLVYYLSDMERQEEAMFQSRWTAVHPERRRAIARHLVDIAEEDFSVDFAPVFHYLFGDQEAAVRVAALDGLWDATDVRLITPMIDLMQADENEEVRTAAAAALAHYVILAEWEEIPRKSSRPIIEALLTVYEHPETAFATRRAALEALGAAPHPRVPALITQAYQSGDAGLQVSAVCAMGNSSDKRWLALVLAELESPRTDMRLEAVRAAGSLGSSDAVDRLETLVYDEDYEVQLAAVVALGQIGGDQAQEVLEAVMADPDSEDLWDEAEEALEEIALFSGVFELFDFDESDFEDVEDELTDDEFEDDGPVG